VRGGAIWRRLWDWSCRCDLGGAWSKPAPFENQKGAAPNYLLRRSFVSAFGRGLCFRFLARGCPEVVFHADAIFDDVDAFGFEEFALEAGVGFADYDFAGGVEDAMPGNAFALRRRGHGAAGAASAAFEAQGFSNGPIG
jgi:hypothetical protein